MQHDPRELLARASDLIGERGMTYGEIENNFQLIADLASLRLGRKIHPYEVATMMCAVKSARLFASPSHTDSRLDLANYEMFAALFAADYEMTTNRSEAVYLKEDELHKAKMVTPPKAEGRVNKTPSTEEIVKAITAGRVREKVTSLEASA